VAKIQALLQRFSLTYTRTAILRSEGRVGVTLDWRLSSPTPFDLVEALIAQVGIIYELGDRLSAAYRVAMHFLLLTYEGHADLYDGIWDVAQEGRKWRGKRRDPTLKGEDIQRYNGLTF
jgi:hypothetical protein